MMDELFTLILVLGASAISIALLVLLNWMIGGWTPSRLKDLQSATSEIETGVLGFVAGPEAVLAADAQAALVLEANGARLGLAVCLGDRVAVRALQPGEVREVQLDGLSLTLFIADYTLPRVHLKLADAQGAAKAQRLTEYALASPEGETTGPSHA